MAFWGVEVKPGKPFHHPPSDASGKRLHVSQATLGIGTATTRSVVQCNVGESTAVLLCTLRPDIAESSQLNLEFEESDEVVFSVLGPLSVHLTGYYVQSLGNEMEPHGEDTANTDHELSVDSANEDDEYEDSFINDGDPGIIPSSPDSGDEDLAVSSADVKCRRKRLKKKIQLIDSSSEEHKIAKVLKPLDNNSEDNLPISLLLSKHKHEEKETIIARETNTLSCKHEEEEEINKCETSKMEQKEIGEVEEIANKDEITKLEHIKVDEEIVLVVDSTELKSCLPKSKDEAKLKEEMVSKVVKPFELGVHDCSFDGIVMGLSAPSTKQEKANEQTENVRKSRKRKKHARLEAKGPIIERAENDREHEQDEVKVVNLEQPMFNEENEKQADDESGSVGKSEKKKRKKKRRNRSYQEKAEAVPE